MKLKNKISGEIKEFVLFDGNELQSGVTLESLTKEWEDAPEEPKEYWFITWCGDIDMGTDDGCEVDKSCKEIGNYFETEEEAEKAVEKLKAWKRLKDKGFRFDEWDENHHNLGIIEFSFDKVENNIWDFEKDLDLLFGGEE